MKFMDNLKRAVGYQNEDEDYEVDETSIDDVPSVYDESAYKPASTSKKSNKVINLHATTSLQVIVVKAEKFEEVGQIADHFKSKKTVVLNLEKTNPNVSRRIVDFLAGVAYAGDGHIKKIAQFTYIITPYNVDITGEIIDELENNMVFDLTD